MADSGAIFSRMPSTHLQSMKSHDGKYDLDKTCEVTIRLFGMATIL
jgi:hypothetical protein